MNELRAGRAFLLETTGDLATATLCSHVGAVRTENQDRVGHAAGLAGEIFIVADGVGGQSGGAEAATLAVHAFEALINPGSGPEDELAEAALQRATEHIHREIQEQREAQPAFNAMATTVAVVYLRDTVATVGHLGDTRVYLFRDGQLERLTCDHSIVERMVLDGLLTEAEARVHPQGHVLTRSLGQVGTPLDTQQIAVRAGDLLLLCSDGLWACVPDAQLAEELARSGTDTSAAVESLLDMTLEAGAPDNVSIVLVRVVAVPEKSVLTGYAETGASEALADAPRRRWTSKRKVLVVLGVLVIAAALAILFVQLR